MFRGRSRGRTLTLTVLLSGLLLASLTVGAGGAAAQKIRPGFWGMHDNNWVTAPGVRVGSANLTTSGTYWTSIEKTLLGGYDWGRLDGQVAAAEAIGAQPMIVLGRTPRFHSSARLSDDYADHMPSVSAWRKFVTAVAGRYGTRLDYQIWPEPNIVENWKGTPRQMATLTMVAAKAITRKAGRKATVVSPAVALRLKSQQKWVVDYFRQKVGGKRVHTYVDAIALDPFPEQKGSPEDSYRLMRSTKKTLARIGVRKPYWNNEINYGVAGGGKRTSTRYTVDKQQAYVIRTFVLSAAARMQRTFWLGWFSTNSMAVKLASRNGTTLPPGTSYGVVRSWLNGTNFRGCKVRKGLWTCAATKGKETRRIYWKPAGKTTIRTPRSTRRVENQEGGVKSRHVSRKRIRVDFRPVMVASRR